MQITSELKQNKTLIHGRNPFTIAPITWFFWLLAFLCYAPRFYALPDSLLAKGLDIQKSLADSLLTASQPFDAVTEYERLMFFDANKNYLFHALYHEAVAWRAGGKFKQSADFFARAYLKAPNDSLKYLCGVNLIRIQLLHGNPEAALQVLDRLHTEPEIKTRKRAALYYWAGWIEIFRNNWQEASVKFGLCDTADFLKNFCLDVHNKKYPLSFIYWISVVLPGSGAIITGNYTSGLIALGWHALWGYTTINAFLNERVFDGVMVGSLLWARFYQGNLENTKKFVEQKNTEIFQNALKYLESEYQGEKP